MLSACLNACTPIQVATETHFFEDLRQRLPQQLGRAESSSDILRRKAEDYFLALSHRHYGESGDPERGFLKRNDLSRMALSLGGELDHYFEAFCILNARRFGKEYWGEKTPRHILFIDEILSRFPKAKIVCAIRDGRAVVASYRDFKMDSIAHDPDDPTKTIALAVEQRRVRRSYHPLLQAMIWRGACNSALRAHRVYGNERIRLLRYEDFVGNPERELGELASWLGTSFNPSGLQTVPHMASSYFSDVQQNAGVSSSPVTRWQSKLSKAEVFAVETCASEQLEANGYHLLKPKTTFLARWRPWCSLPWAAARAALSNKGRHGGMCRYFYRRLRALRNP